MIYKTYGDKLKDPRWQKKRIEVFTRDNWVCQYCGDTETELQVHHNSYSGEPWDVDIKELKSACKHCHACIEETKRLNSRVVPILAVKEKVNKDYHVGLFVDAAGREVCVFLFFVTEQCCEYLTLLRGDFLNRIIKGLNSVQPSQPPATVEE